MSQSDAQRMKWWGDARFGMFIHWGLYSVGGLDCWKMYDMGIPLPEYIARFERRFKPAKFDATAFARVAKNAGCKYVVMGTRHHEGYCLWNTNTTRYSSVSMTPKRDFIAEYIKAIRAAGLKVGIYYSMLDWRYKAYFDGPRKNPAGWRKLVALVHEQVRELMTRYGKIDILWYDGAWPSPWWGYTPSIDEVTEAWQSRKLNAMARKLQPHILINDRSTCPSAGGDFGTPEQTMVPQQRPWELCDNMGYLWGYAPQDRRRKTPCELVTQLIACVANGGNMLLNIGPKPDGSVQKWQARVMEKIGEWMKVHGEAIYGCGRQSDLSYALAPWIATGKGNAAYIHLLNYPGEAFAIANIHDHHFTSARLLDTGERLKIIREPTRDIIKGLPKKAPDPIAPVVKITMRPKTPAEKRRRAWIALDDPEHDIAYD